MTSIDWAALKQTADDATQPAPAGEYDAIVTKADAKTASTGSPMIAVQCKITGGPKDSKVFFHNFVLSPQSAFAVAKFFSDLEAFGLNSEWFTTHNPSMEQIAAELLNKPIHVELGIRSWQGQDRNEVKKFSPASAFGMSPLSTMPGMSVNVPGMNTSSPIMSGPPNPMASIPATPSATMTTPPDMPI